MPISGAKRIVGSALASLMFAGPALAGHNGAEHFWAGPLAPAVGLFGDDGNWSEGVAPGEGEVAVFDTPGIFTVTVDGGHKNDRLILRDGVVSFDMAGHTYELTNPAFGSSEVSFHVGEQAGDEATLTLMDGVLAARQAHIGSFGQGTLMIADGGEVVNDSSSSIGWGSTGAGTVTVMGTDSRWHSPGLLLVGRYGAGTLAIENGGEVVSDSSSVGYWWGSTGTATVAGEGSRWVSRNQFKVGRYGDGTLTIADGGEVVSDSSSAIGWGSTGKGTVMVIGTGSRWENKAQFSVGTSGEGTLTIADGGELVSDSDSFIGRLSGSMGTAMVTGEGSRWQSRAGLFVGGTAASPSGLGSLTVKNGGYLEVAHELQILDTGELTLDDVTIFAGALIAGGDQLEGTGTINAQGLVSNVDLVFDGTEPLQRQLTFNENDGQDITVNVDFAGSNAMGAGATGAGSMLITGGQSITSKIGIIGLTQGAHGIVTLTGEGSRWEAGSLTVGIRGRGTLTVADGGEVVSDSSSAIGAFNSSTGTATVTGAGSRWASGGQFSVGQQGEGTLMIADGGEVVSGSNSSIGSGWGATGTARVAGIGSRWTSGNEFSVGNLGDGTLKIADGGEVVSNSHSFIAPGRRAAGTGVGTVTGEGSRWESKAGLFVGGSDDHAGGDAALRVENGGVVNVGENESVHIWSTGTVSGTGGTIEGDVVNRGRIAPALTFAIDNGSLTGAVVAPGTLSIAGDYEQSADGRFTVALGDEAHDVLAIDRDATLAGTLEVLDAGGATAYWQSRTILEADAIHGRFDAFEYAIAGAFGIIGYKDKAVTLTLGLVGDMNLDGVFDTADVAPFVLALTNPASYIAEHGLDPLLVGDINGDGVFDTADVAPFVQLLVGGADAASPSVPEPGALTCLALAAALLLWRRQRHSARVHAMAGGGGRGGTSFGQNKSTSWHGLGTWAA